MHCPRLKHFARINPDATVGRSGHMVMAPGFGSFEELESSDWSNNIQLQMDRDEWPQECRRCQTTEQLSNTSIRLDSIERDKVLKKIKKDYLIIGGVLDNVCNTACQFCSAELSTKIGTLESGKNYIKINNVFLFNSLPKDRIVELDINGGEPSYSKNYRQLLENLPPNIKIVRINTNASKYLDIEQLLKNNITVIITVSFDGTKKIFEYTRWPIKWSTFNNNIKKYKQLREQYSNFKLQFWSSISAYTVGDLDNMLEYANSHDIPYSYGLIELPGALHIRYKNKFTLTAVEQLKSSNSKLAKDLLKILATKTNNDDELVRFIRKQDILRGTDYNKVYFKDVDIQNK